jgi:adenine nucleotide transporter 17
MFNSFSRILREEGWAGLYGGKLNPITGLLRDTDSLPGIGPKVTQSVITAAFLFAFKDALYNATVKARRTIAQKA